MSQACTDLFTMTPTQIDFYFPFFVFFYGFLAVLVLETPALVKIGEKSLGPLFEGLSRRRNLAWVSFFFGGVWSLQNLWFQ